MGSLGVFCPDLERVVRLGIVPDVLDIYQVNTNINASEVKASGAHNLLEFESRGR